MIANHDHGAIVRQFMEQVFNQGNLDAVSQFVSNNFINFGNQASNGVERWQGIAAMWRTAFPDVHFVLEEEIVQGDKVVQRVTMRGTHLGELRQPTIGFLAPTGQPFEVDQIHIWRLSDGKIVEHWGTRNDVKLLRQLGAWSAPTPPA